MVGCARCGVLFLTCAFSALVAAPLAAQSATRPTPGSSLLRALDASVEELTRAVSVSVVQVLVTGYGLVDDRGHGETGLVIGPQRSLGSGVIVGSEGYIITNAHVIAGAQRLQVVLHSATTDETPILTADQGHVVDARIVGTAHDLDLALIKVEATGLRALPFADYSKIRQGELVFAFGSPAGLLNSVTMGVVSAVARQPDPDSPTVYVQTDAPINPGNSGGPLVNVDGEIVGLNTFIVSVSGGSQGLGFAIPSEVINTAYPQ